LEGVKTIHPFIKMRGFHPGGRGLLDPSGKTLDLFEINKIPATLLIDKNGKMIGRAIGPRNWSSPEVFSLIDQMLHDRPSRVVSLKD